jgi:hypothetical protein
MATSRGLATTILIVAMMLLHPSFIAPVNAMQNYNLSTSSLTPSTVTAIISPTTHIIQTTTYITIPYNGTTGSTPTSTPSSVLATNAPVIKPNLQSHAASLRAQNGMAVGFASLALMVGWFYLIV